jgi:hypothetical protein
MKLYKLALATAVSTLLGGAVQAQDYEVPETQWGQPDLQGVWNFSSTIPLERPAFFADKAYLTEQDLATIKARTEQGLQAINNIGVGGYNTFWTEMGGTGDNRTSLIMYPENGRMPDTVEGVAIQVGGLGPDEPGTRPTRMVGFNSGPPFTPNLYNNNVQIVQAKDTVVIMTEMIHDARIVPLTDKPALSGDVRLWTGDSRGYWDGEALVVETRNFNNFTQSFGVYGSAEDKLLTERFTRTDEFTVEYEFTVEDPSTFKDKIVAMVPMSKVDGLMYEYACHEGNYGLLNTLRGERISEQREAEGKQ